MIPVASLTWREIVRFFRQRNRIVGALGTPIVFWVLLGSGFHGSFRGDGANYLVYLFPGTAVLILLFAAIFSTISIIEDRREGFLQGVLASPVPRSSIVLSKLLGGTAIAVAQAGLFLALGPLAGVGVTPVGALQAGALFMIIAFGLTGLGFLVAWRMDSAQGFHAVINLFLMPMWFLSGALFPVEGAPAWLQWTVRLNPLSYGMSAVRHALSEGRMAWPAVAVIGMFGAIMFAACVGQAARPE
ncbi:MAG: ABC transporter permease [Planctomycetes bacterium]|nr:ABC transporter permease [Planctomycetota bacterium]